MLTNLISLPIEYSRVGYGELGFQGDLGYDGGSVQICGESIPDAISAHAPSHIKFRSDKSFSTFRAWVGINDSAPVDATSADFLVIADGKLAGISRNVRPSHPLRSITAHVGTAQTIELVAQTQRPNHCHSVWVNPTLSSDGICPERTPFLDCTQRSLIEVPTNLPCAPLYIVTVASSGFEKWLEGLLYSIQHHFNYPDLRVAVFNMGNDSQIREASAKYDAITIPCRPLHTLNASSKAVMYSAGCFIPAEHIICLDVDMLVLGDLRPVVDMIEASQSGSIVVCREAQPAYSLEDALLRFYGGSHHDFLRLTGHGCEFERHYSLIVNDGFFAGSRASLCALDSHLRDMKLACEWIDDPSKRMPWRNQFLFNLALASLNCGVEMNSRFNVQLDEIHCDVKTDFDNLTAEVDAASVAILHFNARGRDRLPQFRDKFCTTTISKWPVHRSENAN